jgi:hypothetical protein
LTFDRTEANVRKRIARPLTTLTVLLVTLPVGTATAMPGKTGTAVGTLRVCTSHPLLRSTCRVDRSVVILLSASGRLVAHRHVIHGLYRFRHLVAGRYMVVIHPDAEPSRAYTATITLRPGKTTRVPRLGPPVP